MSKFNPIYWLDKYEKLDGDNITVTITLLAAITVLIGAAGAIILK